MQLQLTAKCLDGTQSATADVMARGGQAREAHSGIRGFIYFFFFCNHFGNRLGSGKNKGIACIFNEKCQQQHMQAREREQQRGLQQLLTDFRSSNSHTAYTQRVSNSFAILLSVAVVHFDFICVANENFLIFHAR